MKKLALAILSLTFFSCSSSDDDAATPITPAPVNNSVAYFYSKINNVSLTFDQDNTMNPTSYNSASLGFRGIGSDKYFYYGSMMERYNSSDVTSLDLTFHNMYHSTSYSDETTNFYSNFNIKPTNFLTEAQESNLEKGISVFYTDASGETYSSLYGSQTGSTIAYTSSTQGTNTFGLQTLTIVGTVNCKLYNTNDVTDVKTLTNGSYKLTFQEFD